MYDIVICGGGTAGVACAYIASKLGLKTLLVEKNIHLGGSMTSALVTPAMKSTTNGLNCEFYNEFIKRLAEKNAQITYIDGNTGWFNPEIAKIVLDEILTNVGCDVLFNTEIVDAIKENNRIKSIKVSSNMLSLCIESRYFVDCTGDGNFSFKIKNEILKNENKFQALTLRFNVSGVDLNKFSNWICHLDKDRDITTTGIIDNEIHLSTACTWDNNKKWALSPIFEEAVRNNDLKDTDAAYFQLFTIPGMPNTVALNCPRILQDKEYSPLDPKNTSIALQQGRQQIWRLFNFMKKYLPGFENSFISNIADMLGVRESRRIKGKYLYTKDDLISGKTFDNPVLTADYPIDIHSNNRNSSTLEFTRKVYQLPIESLCASDYENLFMAGRNLSADFEAQAALRIQTSCFSMGEAVAKHISTLIKEV